MVFWLIAALMTVGLVWTLARPLATRASAEPAAASAMRIYKDQLAEISTDEARGLIGPAEAEAARVEVSRRLLAAAGSATAVHASNEISARYLIRGLAIAMPLSAIGLYLAFGAPMLPDRPFAARQAAVPADAPVAELIARVEKRLRERPDDGQGWDVIAPIYLRLERFSEASMAFARAIDLLGESPKRLIGLGEALVYQNNGLVTEEARRAWGRLIEIAPDNAEGRFWLALADEQDGRFASAADAYRRLLASSPPDAPWRPTVTERLGIVEKRLGGVRLPSERSIVSDPSTPKGPSAADIAAAGQMAPADRQQMIEQMVAGLSERLRTSGGDIESWERLVRSYTILGRRDDAMKALADARRAVGADGASAARLDALAKNLGLGG